MAKKIRSSESQIYSEALYHAVLWANRSTLGCKIRRVKAERFFDYTDRRHHNDNRSSAKDSTNLVGTAKDGRSIYVHYLVGGSRMHLVPKRTRLFMLEMEKLGAIVGVARDYSDVFDIIKGEKRLPRTYSYRNDVYEMRKENAKTKEDSGEEGIPIGCDPERDAGEPFPRYDNPED